MNKSVKIYIAGHRGMVGSAIWRALEGKGYTNLIGRTSSELDLRNQVAVADFFHSEQPEIVIDAAARVGGILANDSYPYSFLMENLQIQNNLLELSLKTGVEKFIFLGSSCIYPKLAPQPLKEDFLLAGPLEPTNEGYALAKIAGVKACEAIRRQFGKEYISLMPTNLYGPHDNFDLLSSHVLPAMIRKFHEAKQSTVDGQHPPVTLWGSGKPLREFMHVDDMADAVVFVLENNVKEHFYNVGTGQDLSINALAEMIQNIVGHGGKITWDTSMPDGTRRKLLDVSKLTDAGWKAKIGLEEGIKATYAWYVKQVDTL